VSSNDLENMAIMSMIAGIVSAIFIIVGAGTAMEFWGLLAGVFAVGSGVRVLRGDANNKKLAATGTIMGTIGLAFWVLIKVATAAAFLWHLL
jgi:hypothetical protein